MEIPDSPFSHMPYHTAVDAQPKNMLTPHGRWDRIKWLCGVENSVNTTLSSMFASIESQIEEVKNSKAQNFFELTSQFKKLPNLEATRRLFVDQLTIQEPLRNEQIATLGTIMQLFISCMSYLMHCRGVRYFFPSVSAAPIHSPSTSLQTFLNSTYATVGGFTITKPDSDNLKENVDTHYEVRMYINLKKGTSDFNSIDFFITSPNTPCEIVKDDNPYHVFSIDLPITTLSQNSLNPTYQTLEIYYQFKDQTAEKPSETPRLLDEKLTQIMIEILLKHSWLDALKVSASESDAIVFAACGFHSQLINEEYKSGEDSDSGDDSDDNITSDTTMLNALSDLRNQRQNPYIYPSYEDYGERTMSITTIDSRRNSAHFRTWEEIIKTSPILSQKGGLLPRFANFQPEVPPSETPQSDIKSNRSLSTTSVAVHRKSHSIGMNSVSEQNRAATAAAVLKVSENYKRGLRRDSNTPTITTSISPQNDTVLPQLEKLQPEVPQTEELQLTNSDSEGATN